jgi:hypothetical protein
MKEEWDYLLLPGFKPMRGYHKEIPTGFVICLKHPGELWDWHDLFPSRYTTTHYYSEAIGYMLLKNLTAHIQAMDNLPPDLSKYDHPYTHYHQTINRVRVKIHRHPPLEYLRLIEEILP